MSKNVQSGNTDSVVEQKALALNENRGSVGVRAAQAVNRACDCNESHTGKSTEGLRMPTCIHCEAAQSEGVKGFDEVCVH